jgi:2-oxoisovalerate dehydrogenase E1 component
VSTQSLLTEKHGVSKSDLLTLLRQMMLIREIEQKSLELSTATPPEIAGSVHLCAGQEAVPVGTIAGLNHTDQVVATYRGHGWALASGLSPLEVFGEICHRKIGVNGGRGGSAYMMAPDRRFIGENSIVGAGVPVACGVAMANVSAGNGGVVVVSVGDGAFNQGSTHEGLAFAAARSLPVIIICENNGWSELTPTSLTFKISRIAQRASAYGIPGVTIDGSNPLDVRDTIRQAAKRAREGAGPALVECRVPRLWGHYNRDIEHYRSKEDREEARSRDPIEKFSNQLVQDGLVDQREIAELSAKVKSEVQELAEEVLRSPLPDASTAGEHVWAPTVRPSGSRTSHKEGEAKSMSFIQAVNEALNRELETRPEVLVYGEDLGNSGGVFGATRGLQKKYGEQRVFDTPISESAILGSAVGAALCDMKPIVEIMWADFMLVALDQIVNQAANVRYITQGRSGAPIVVRTQQGVTPGSCAQHSQSLEALLAHIPGIRVAVSATPQDAYDLLRSATAASDPCVVFEARALYQTTGPVVLDKEVEPMGKARLHRQGKDAVIVTWGTMLKPALDAAEMLRQEKREVGVLDLRWLSPLDEEALLAAVKHASGRVVVAHEANRTGGFGAEIVARLQELAGSEIPLKSARVATPNVRMPASPVLMRELVPTPKRIAEAVRKLWA